MNYPTPPGSTARDSAACKLHPANIQIDPFFRAILAYLLNQEHWTNPVIVSLRCDMEGVIWARDDGAQEHKKLCHHHELIAHVLSVAQVVELTPRERAYVLSGIPKNPQPETEIEENHEQ